MVIIREGKRVLINKMKKLRHKLSSMALVVGASLFVLGVLNHSYYRTRMYRAKSAIPQRIFELNEKMEGFDRDPNSNREESMKAFAEAYAYNREFDLVKQVDNYKLRVKNYNESRLCTRLLGFAGLGVLLAGYVGKQGGR